MDQEPPTKLPHYDRKTKRISVETTIGVESFKFIAAREAWLAAWKTKGFLENLSLADVKPFLGRNKKESVQALAELAENNQAIFAQGFLNCVLAANSQNPLYGPARKVRGKGKVRSGSDKAFDWQTRNRISRLFLKLHFYIRFMWKTPMRQRPVYFNKFCKKYFMESGNDAGSIPTLESSFVEIEIPEKTTELASVVAKAISDHLGFEFKEYSYETFVKKRRLTLKQLKHPELITPELDPELAELFARFQK
jgi:hypothetical protein